MVVAQILVLKFERQWNTVVSFQRLHKLILIYYKTQIRKEIEVS